MASPTYSSRTASATGTSYQPSTATIYTPGKSSGSPHSKYASPSKNQGTTENYRLAGFGIDPLTLYAQHAASLIQYQPQGTYETRTMMDILPFYTPENKEKKPTTNKYETTTSSPLKNRQPTYTTNATNTTPIPEWNDPTLTSIKQELMLLRYLTQQNNQH